MGIPPWHTALRTLNDLGLNARHPVALGPRKGLDGRIELRQGEVLALGDEHVQQVGHLHPQKAITLHMHRVVGCHSALVNARDVLGIKRIDELVDANLQQSSARTCIGVDFSAF